MKEHSSSVIKAGLSTIAMWEIAHQRNCVASPQTREKIDSEVGWGLGEI